jgi:hypothetical protein
MNTILLLKFTKYANQGKLLRGFIYDYTVQYRVSFTFSEKNKLYVMAKTSYFWDYSTCLSDYPQQIPFIDNPLVIGVYLQ